MKLSESLEAAFNAQITLEFQASLVYRQLSIELDLMDLSAMIGRQLPFFSLLVPFWLIWAFAGFRAMRDVWPAILVTGVSFAVPQFLVSNYIGPMLVDVI